MTLEERLIGCYVLNADDAVRTNGNNLVDKLHWVAVWKKLTDALVVHNRLFIRVVDRCLNLMFADLLTHQAGKLIVYSVSRTCCNDATLDWFTNESHITDDIKELMACALVVPHQRLVLDVTDMGCIDVRNMKKVGELV